MSIRQPAFNGFPPGTFFRRAAFGGGLFGISAVRGAVFGRLGTRNEYLQLFVRAIGGGQLSRFPVDVYGNDAAWNAEYFRRHAFERFFRKPGKNRRCAVAVQRGDGSSLVITYPDGRGQLRRIATIQASVSVVPVLPATGRLIREEMRLPVPPDSNTLSIRWVKT